MKETFRVRMEDDKIMAMTVDKINGDQHGSDAVIVATQVPCLLPSESWFATECLHWSFFNLVLLLREGMTMMITNSP
jgi:hypothetical protein